MLTNLPPTLEEQQAAIKQQVREMAARGRPILHAGKFFGRISTGRPFGFTETKSAPIDVLAWLFPDQMQKRCLEEPSRLLEDIAMDLRRENNRRHSTCARSPFARCQWRCRYDA